MYSVAYNHHSWNSWTSIYNANTTNDMKKSAELRVVAIDLASLLTNNHDNWMLSVSYGDLRLHITDNIIPADVLHTIDGVATKHGLDYIIGYDGEIVIFFTDANVEAEAAATIKYLSTLPSNP